MWLWEPDEVYRNLKITVLFSNRVGDHMKCQLEAGLKNFFCLLKTNNVLNRLVRKQIVIIIIKPFKKCLTWSFCIDPSTPGIITVSQNKDFFVIKWEHSIGRVEFYKILKSSVCTFAYIHQVPFTAAMINGTTNELKLTTVPGVCCFLHVVAVSNNVISNRQNYTIKHSEAGIQLHLANIFFYKIYIPNDFCVLFL